MSTAGKKTRRIFDQRFELVGELGRGKKSVVYHALHDGKEGADVALKVLLPVKTLDPLKNRLRAEAQAMLMAQHPYVLGLKDFQYYENLSYIALEYAPLGDLRKYARSNGGKLPFEQVELFLRQISEALHFIHSLGLIHRDVKPDNILAISPEEVRLADFGVALIQENPGISADLNAAIGTMDYLSPEVLDGKEYGPQGDIYSLGVTAYELISGLHPFADLPLANMMEARIKGPQPLDSLVPDISQPLAQTIGLMLASDTDKRFKKASEIIDSLNSPPSKKSAKSKNSSFFKDAENEKSPVSTQDTEISGNNNDRSSPEALSSDQSPQVVNIKEPLLHPTIAQGINNDESIDTDTESKQETNQESKQEPSLRDGAYSGQQSVGQTAPPSREYRAKTNTGSASFLNSAIWGNTSIDDADNADNADNDNRIKDIQQNESDSQIETSQGLLPHSLRGAGAADVDEIHEDSRSLRSSLKRSQNNLNGYTSSKTSPKARAANRVTPPDNSDESENGEFSQDPRLSAGRLGSRSKLIRLIFILGLGLCALFVYQNFFSTTSTSSPVLHLKKEHKVIHEDDPPSEAENQPQAASLSQLKQGVYAGSITGILTKSPLPLFFDVKESGIYIFLGVQGWTPVRADIVESNLIEVSSNGLVLSLKITGKDFSGTIQDLLSGETGTWTVQRQASKN